MFFLRIICPVRVLTSKNPMDDGCRLVCRQLRPGMVFEVITPADTDEPEEPGFNYVELRGLGWTEIPEDAWDCGRALGPRN
jgi:hypothetical protein